MRERHSLGAFLKKQTFGLVFLVLLCVAPLFIKNAYILSLFSEIFFFAAMGCAWNILGGFGRQISWCSASFVAVGAYTTSIFFIKGGGVSPWITIWLGIVLAVVLAVIIGLPCFRLRGVFFSIATISFATIVRQLLLNFPDFTGGAQGLTFKIRTQSNFWELAFKKNTTWFYVALVLMIITIVITMLIDRSRMGYYLKAVREEEDAAESLGVRAHKLKLRAFVISAALMAAIGCFYAFMKAYIDPTSFASHDLSVKIGVVAILGGMGTIWGPVLGAFVTLPVMEAANFSLSNVGQGGAGLALYGLIMVLVIMLRPNGLISLFNNVKIKLPSSFKVGVKGGRKS